MRSTAERRQMILQVLCERRSELAENLALEFDVSIRTIYYDIEFLAYSYSNRTRAKRRIIWKTEQSPKEIRKFNEYENGGRNQ